MYNINGTRHIATNDTLSIDAFMHRCIYALLHFNQRACLHVITMHSLH